jgi:hypothetical protein
LTHCSLKGNPLPPPPADAEKLFLREDIGAEKIADESERRYRHYSLQLFQKLVGKESKPKVQLIVFDNIRVKNKWSHLDSEVIEEESCEEVAQSSVLKKKRKARMEEKHEGTDTAQDSSIGQKKRSDETIDVSTGVPDGAVRSKENRKQKAFPVETKEEQSMPTSVSVLPRIPPGGDSGLVRVRDLTKKSKNDDTDAVAAVLELSGKAGMSVGLGGNSAW